MAENQAYIEQGELYAGYAADTDIRAHASSGGIVSAILIDLLETGRIDGALVSMIGSRDSHIRGVTERAVDRAGILQCAGSSYIETPVIGAARNLREITGRYALVGLPCQIRTLRKYLSTRPGLKEKIPYIIGLFCRGTVAGGLYDDLFLKYGIARSAVATVKVRREHIGGDLIINLADGTSRTIPFRKMNSYRIAGIHSMPRCLWCSEHLAAEADIAGGDIFTGKYRKKQIKHSAFVCWSGTGASLMEETIKKGLVTAEYFGMKRYRRTFAGIETFSNRLGPRYMAARLTGARPRGRPSAFNNIFHSLAWTIIFANNRLSRTMKGRKLLFGLPSWVIQLEAMTVKALSRIHIGGPDYK